MYDKKSKIIVKVSDIVNYGAFCKLENADGLIHISEMSDYYVKDIRDFVNVGDSIEVEVIDYDPIKKQAKLSYKSCNPELLKEKDNNLEEKTVTSPESVPNKQDSLSK